MLGNERDDRLASTALVAGTITKDEIEIVKKIYDRVILDDSRTSKSVGVKMSEFAI